MKNLSSRKPSQYERLAQSSILRRASAFLPIVLIGAILRLWNLGTWSLWIDEVLTVLDAQQLSVNNLPINPVSYLAVRMSLLMGSTDEWGARLIPCVVGIASIPLIFLMGRSLVNPRVGAFAASFVAFSNWHLFWSQNARSYIFTFLFGALTAWGFYLALERNRPIVMIGALLSAICLLLSHTLSVTILPALAGYVISFCVLQAFPRVANLLPLGSSNTPSTGASDEPAGIFPAGLRAKNLLIFFIPFILPILLFVLPEFRNYLFSGWGFNEWNRSPIYIIFTLVYGLSVPIAATALFTFFLKPKNRIVWFLVCYAGIPLLLLIIVSGILNVAGYYLFFTTPAYFLLAAVGCDRIWQCKSLGLTLRAILPCIIILTMLSQNYLYFYIENGARPRWREAFSLIRSEMNDEDQVVTSLPKMSQYYLPELQSTAAKKVLENRTKLEKEWKRRGIRVWFVIDAGSFNVFDSEGEFRQWVHERTRLIHTFPVFARAMDRTINVYLSEVVE